MIGFNLAAALAAAFSSQEESQIEVLARKKLQSAGNALVDRLIAASPLGAAFSAMQAAEEWLGPGDEFSKVGQDLIRSAMPRQPAALRSVRRLLQSSFADTEQPARGTGRQAQRRTGRRWTARSRAEWMANKWRRDWRSQPRRPAGSDAGGEWMEGRLPYQVSQASLISRKQRQKRTRAIKAYKQRMAKAGYKRTRSITTSWGRF